MRVLKITVAYGEVPGHRGTLAVVETSKKGDLLSRGCDDSGMCCRKGLAFVRKKTTIQHGYQQSTINIIDSKTKTKTISTWMGNDEREDERQMWSLFVLSALAEKRFAGTFTRQATISIFIDVPSYLCRTFLRENVQKSPTKHMQKLTSVPCASSQKPKF